MTKRRMVSLSLARLVPAGGGLGICVRRTGLPAPKREADPRGDGTGRNQQDDHERPGGPTARGIVPGGDRNRAGGVGLRALLLAAVLLLVVRTAARRQGGGRRGAAGRAGRRGGGRLLAARRNLWQVLLPGVGGGGARREHVEHGGGDAEGWDCLAGDHRIGGLAKILSSSGCGRGRARRRLSKNTRLCGWLRRPE